MRKYLCLVLLLSLFALSLFSLDRSVVCGVCNSNISYEFIDDNTVKIPEENLEIFIEKLDINILRINSIFDRKIIEGYTTKIKDYFVVDNLKINVQISVYDGVAIIGSPLILGGF